MPGKRIITTGAVICLLTAAATFLGLDWLNEKFDLKSKFAGQTNAVAAAPSAPGSPVTSPTMAPAGATTPQTTSGQPATATTPQIVSPNNGGAQPGNVSPAPTNLAQGLVAEYFNLPERGWDGLLPTTNPAVRQYVNSAYFDWGHSSPSPRIGSKLFAARFTGFIKVDQAGVYTFRVAHNKGARIVLDQQVILDQWRGSNSGVTFDMPLNRAGWVPIQIEYWGGRGPAIFKLEWATPNAGDFKLIPATHLAHQQ
jgi:hypothetical protein